MELNWGFAVVLVATSFLTALGALLLVAYLPTWPRPRRAMAQWEAGDDTVFLFDDEFLLDATPKARRLLAQGPEDLNEWHRLAALLSPRFPDFLAEMSRLGETGLAMLDEAAGTARIKAQWSRGVARISLLEPVTDPEAAPIDVQSLAAMNAEIDILRRVVAHMPTLVWQQDNSGDVTWANRAYLKLVEETQHEEDELVWPLPRLFDTDQTGGMAADFAPRRFSVPMPEGDAQWFDCVAFPQPDMPMFFAVPANATVHAETSLHNFVQTLTKTFAGLPTGLAIFNRSRQLVMFNPALVDLCMLEPHFLISRPSLFAFFDRLREKKMMPEPKNYKTWRQKMTALEKEAVSGVYEETWTLPTGQTYRVSGRPHPDGAVAFLVEDISSEVSLTRSFRAELEMGQAVLDSLEEAIAIFSPAGVLTLANAAYARLLGDDPLTTLGDVGIHDATQVWQGALGESPLWADIRAQILGEDRRGPFERTIQVADGATLRCRMTPISGGATLVGFTATNSGPMGQETAVSGLAS